MKKQNSLTTKRPVQLHHLLKYKNPEIVARFCKEMGVKTKVGNQVFKDLMKFLFLNSRLHYYHQEMQAGRRPKKDLPPMMFILDSMLIIDEMWHTFVLYTSEYELFCIKYFGHYLHHEPTPTLRHLRQKAVTFNPDHLENFIEFVWDELGEETATRWFGTYQEKFHKKAIAKLKFKSFQAA